MPFSPAFDAVFLDGVAAIPAHLSSKFTIDLIRLDREVYARRQIEENVLRYIDKSNLLLADITRYTESLQPNVSVMHEIGYACGRGVPFILFGKEHTHKNLPSNLQGSLVMEYDQQRDPELKDFARRLAQQTAKIIETQVLQHLRGDYRVECFSDRQRIGLPQLIEKAKRHIYILTTNLDYTSRYLTSSIKKALEANSTNSAFKVEILTMDPEGDVTNARAIQLGRKIRGYRNELRESLDNMRKGFEGEIRVEIVTYKTLPTQMTFIVDDTVVTGIVSLAQQSREGVHFVVHKLSDLAGMFLAHFRALKTLAIANTE